MAIIEVEHVTKEYRLGAMQSLKTIAGRMLGRVPPDSSNFKALDDISFSIERGEVVGLLGHNGAGKSTLLKILSKITIPTNGKINTNGSITPMIEVGGGFIGELTGKENIYLNAALLGIPSITVKEKIQEVIDFSELDRFIDTPYKRYSSGMQAKLAFSVAIAFPGDILIIDEVLAVGDMAFQKKCYDRLEKIIHVEKRTILLVSHNVRQIERLCHRALILDAGKLVFDGSADKGCQIYLKNQKSNNKLLAGAKTRNQTIEENFELHEIKIIGKNGLSTNNINYKDSFTIEADISLNSDLDGINVTLGLHTNDFIYAATDNTTGIIESHRFHKGHHKIKWKINNCNLTPNIYNIRMSCTYGIAAHYLFYSEGLLSFEITDNENILNMISSQGFIHLDSEWSLESKS